MFSISEAAVKKPIKSVRKKNVKNVRIDYDRLQSICISYIRTIAIPTGKEGFAYISLILIVPLSI